ncbi:MAG: serine/threonine-protein kinase, partial [Kiritimatiellae bacterium]|nr:serine/threonine-protein kinase [Kiritimatiellia bacterium]
MTNYDIIGKRVDSIACNKCGTVMDVCDAEPFSIVQCPKCGTRQAIPKRLGDFLLLQFLGKGGMGAVFQGYDTKLGRQVAIKVLGKVLGDDPAAMDNFLREARAAAQINSPYVVQIFQVGEERNKPFIVMELINGGQLDKMIEHRPLPELRALEVCRDAALGLQSAQEMGLFHGDIKPENILFDQHQTAKIADFGLAQFLQRGQHSKPGEIWGTPYYIAPEKARRQQEDYRSDIYSLGATLFHALTGQPPFEGETAADVVLARLKNYAPSILDINSSLHEATAKLVARMLEPDPAMRYPNYTSLLSDMESVIQIVKRTPAQPTGQKKKGCGFWVVLFFILLAAGGIGAYFFLHKEDAIFTEEEQQQLIKHANMWTRNIYRFEPAALLSMDDSLVRFDTSLPAGHPGKDWIPIFRSTVQLLALNTNELTNTLSKLLEEKNIPALIDGKPNRALMP